MKENVARACQISAVVILVVSFLIIVARLGPFVVHATCIYVYSLKSLNVRCLFG